ncbi:MAG TPA: DUF4440 domain-containing protein [Pyrinomonadaceae bacterium]|jgi:hypothetical protein|nr:DUF4440 domain-containing protein [Pyrinomonadaceae bacterium]
MKRCSTCNRTFTDPNLRFCIEDGTPLTDVEPDDETTTVTPRNQPRNQNDSWDAVAYQPPRSNVPPGSQTRRRRAWPWLVGIGGAFILGVLMIAIAGVVLAPRITRRIEQAQSNANRRAENANTAPAPESNSNSNTNSTEHGDVPAPTDQEQVLTQLKNIENEWTVANLNADKKKLDQILADDFVGETDGQTQSKAEYIETIQRDTQIDKWEFSNLKLVLTGDRATLSGMITLFNDDRKAAFDFTDKFVWRDGRWQATGSTVKEASNSGVDL